jgi:hypothetical protein
MNSNNDLEQLDIRDVDPKSYRKPDLILDLEANRDYIKREERQKKRSFYISITTLAAILLIIIKAEPEDIPNICQILMPILALIVGYWLGSRCDRESARKSYEKTD